MTSYLACGGGADSPTAPTTVFNRPVTDIAMNVTAMTLRVGGVGLLSATVTYEDGSTGTASGVWASSQPSVASVTTASTASSARADGQVTAYAIGAATITVTQGGRSASALVTVIGDNTAPPPPSPAGTFTLSGQVTEHEVGPLPDAVVTILDGEHIGQTATTDAIGNFSMTALTGHMNFSVTKEGYGEQRFGASADNASHTVTMHRLFVLAGTVRSHRNEPLEGVTVTILDGAQEGWTANTNTDGYYKMIDVWGNFNISFTKAGYLEQRTGVNINTPSYDFTMTPPYIRLEVDADTEVLALDRTTRVEAKAHYGDGSAVEVVPAWVSSDSSVATVSANGTVRGLRVGSVQITGTYNGKSDSVTIDVREIILTSITVSISNTSLAVGDSATATATARYSDGTEYQVSAAWSSSNSNVASVSQSGSVTARASGSAVITGTFEGKSSSVSVDVYILTSVAVSLSNTSLTVGDSATATATAHYSNGTQYQVSAAWSSSNSNVASVSQSGSVTARAPGSAVITGTFGGKNGSATVDVREQESWSLTGRVRSLQSSGSVSTATVNTKSGPSHSGTTNGSGQFRFAGTANHGTSEVEISKSGFLTRSVYLPWAQTDTWNDVTMIQQSGGFDYNFWLEFIRNSSDDPGGYADEYLWRWNNGNPNFYIRTTGMSSNDETAIRNYLPSIVSSFTDGRLGVGSIQSGTEDRNQSGWITIKMEELSGNTSGMATIGGDPGWIKLDPKDNLGAECVADHFSLGVFSHEVGHALGFNHVSDSSARMYKETRSGECNATSVLSKERYHGGLAYQRKRFNQHPDKEPHPSWGFRGFEPPVIIVVD